VTLYDEDPEDDTWGRVPVTCPDIAAAEKLVYLMSEISEEYYAAGWLMGLEYTLWHIIFEDPTMHFGGRPLTLAEIGELLELTTRCQGWWIWSKNRSGLQFLTYDEWLPMYQRGPRD
jgi:hypothetical protein